MIKKTLIFTALLVGFLNGYSQFPVGKKSTIAEKELKQTLKGYTFLKKDSSTDEMESFKFSEEFIVILGKNYYENVSYMNIHTFKKKIMDRIKITFNFSKWTYVGEFPNVENEIESVYKYKGFKIRMPHPDGSYQFIVTLDE